VCTGSAFASTYTVTSTNDDGSPGSLRWAISQANIGAGNTINFSGVSGTITLTSDLPIVNQPMTITGPGARVLTISGDSAWSIFEVVASGSVSISGLTISNGVGPNPVPISSSGGGVLVYSGTVSVSGCVFSNNSAVYGGAVANYNGILSISNSTFLNNTATYGGAVESQTSPATTLAITGSTFQGNSLASGGYGGAIEIVEGYIVNSTFIGNSAPGGSGGAVEVHTTATMTNDTFYGNSANSGGAVDAYVSIQSNNVFAGNAATSQGGAVLNNHVANASNNVYWQNLAAGAEDDCHGCSIDANAISASSNPLALPVNNWGGTTQTLLPQPASAAICAGSATLAVDSSGNALTNDQRGWQLNSANCSNGGVDAGAVQSNYLTVTQIIDSDQPTYDCTSGTGASCSLRNAIAQAGTGQADIQFRSDLLPNTMVLSPGNFSLSINGAVNIIGPGADQLNIRSENIAFAGPTVRVFPGAVTTIYGLTISDGNSTASPGAGISNAATATLLSSVVTGNTNSFCGGGIGNTGTMTIGYSTIWGNTGTSSSQGGGICNKGTMSIFESTIAGNTSGPNGGGIYSTGPLTLTNTTVTGNQANSSGFGASGGGITNVGTLTLANTIVAGNSVSTDTNSFWADVQGGFNDDGGNFASTDRSPTSVANPQVGPLQVNGIGTALPTLMPLPGSPVLCLGTVSGLGNGVTTDNRGYPNTNTSYAGFSAASPCVDAGAVQTNYTSVGFVQQPTDTQASAGISPAPTVQILETDSLLTSNNTDAVNGVPITLNYSGGAAEIGGSLTSTTNGGVATYGLGPNMPGNGFTLSAGADGNGIFIVSGTTLTAVSQPFTVLGAAASLAVSAPSTVTAGLPFSISVTALDSANNIASTDNDAVDVTITGQPTVLGTVQLSAGSGSATVTLTAAGTATLTGTDSGASVTGTSNTIAVGPAAPAQIVASGFPTPAYRGVLGAGLVTEEDAFGNTVTSDSISMVTLATSDGAATLSSPVTLTNGVAAFTATLNTLGFQGITPTLGGLTSVSQTGIAVVPVPNLVVNTASDDPGDASKCSQQANAGFNFTDAACSLRDALLATASRGVANVSFDGAVFSASKSTAQNTITLTHGTLNVPTHASITGPTSGSGATLANLVTVAGGGSSSNFSIITVAPGAGAALANLNISQGNTTGPGGAINNNAGALTIRQCTFSSNTSNIGGAIYNNGSLTLTGSTISNNSAGTGGGIDNESQGSLTLIDDTFSGNTASISGGAINFVAGVMALNNATISGNFAGGTGAGIYVAGAGTVQLGNTIVSGNQLGSLASPGNYDDFDDTTGNTLFAYGNSGGLLGFYNAPSATAPAAPANLAPLGNYGGPTPTMPPLPASAAICNGSLAAIPNGVSSDQRGFANTNTSYPGFSSTACTDSGAVQTNYALSFATNPASQVGTGVAMSPAPVVALTDNGLAATAATSVIGVVDNDNVLGGTLTASLSGGSAIFSNLVMGSSEAGDTLTATLSIAPAINLTAASTPFSANTPVLSIGKTHTGSFVQGQTAEWDVTVRNTATGTTTFGVVLVTDTLPSGYTLSSYDSTGHAFACAGINAVSCSTSAAIASGGSLTIRMMVSVPANSATQVSNTALAWGGGDASHTSKATAVSATDLNVAVTQVPASIAINGSPTQSVAIVAAYGSLAVTVKDAGGVTIPSYNVLFAAPPPGLGASGIFARTSTNTVTVRSDTNGVADPGVFTANNILGPFPVSVAAGNVSTSFSMTNTAGPLSIIFIFPNPTAIIGWPTSYGAIALDAGGNLLTNLTDSVTVTSSDPAAILPTNISFSGGFATFSVIFNTAGNQTVTMTDNNPAPPVSSMSSVSVSSPSNLVVTTTADDAGNAGNCTPQAAPGTGTDSHCSLRDALLYAASAGSGNITFDSSHFNSGKSAAANTIVLTNGVLTIPTFTAITGSYTGAGTSLKNLVTVSGNHASGVFQQLNIMDGAKITGLAIVNGSISSSASAGQAMGAGIFVGGSLYLNNSTVRGNSINTTDLAGESYGGGIGVVGGLSMQDDLITGNSAQSAGQAYGGGIYDNGLLLATGIVVSGNTVKAADLTGDARGAGIYNATPVGYPNVTSAATTTIANTTAVGPSLGVGSARGGGIDNAGYFSLSNTTISGNSATASGSGTGGGIDNEGTLLLTNATVSANTADNGGGVVDRSMETLANSIVSGNVASIHSDLLEQGTTTDSGGNFVSLSPIHLAPLGNYGGTSRTMPPLPGSPAICGGLAKNIAAGTTADQRGLPNTNSAYPGYSVGSACVDSGAVQTNYALTFTQQPSTSGAPATLAAGANISPAPVVSVTESGNGMNGVAVTLSDSSATLTGNLTVLTLAGDSTFKAVAIPHDESNDALTASLSLNSSIPLALSTTSYPFNVVTIAPTLTSPSGSSGQLSGSTPFTWAPGAGVHAFRLKIGVTGPGSTDIYDSANLAISVLSETVNIPANGATLYVRLSYVIGGTSQFTDYTFTEAGTPTAPSLTTPTGMGSLSGPTLFTWDPGAGSTGFLLKVGTSLYGSEIYNSGKLATTITSKTVNISATTVFVQLGYEVNGVWLHKEYTFGVTAPALTAPSGPAPISGSTLFTWNPGAGSSTFRCKVGTTGPGSADLADTGNVPASVTSITTNVPANGATVYVRLAYIANGVSQHIDYVFHEE
jgi:CSLREA domain-containing protein